MSEEQTVPYVSGPVWSDREIWNQLTSKLLISLSSLQSLI